MPHFTEPAPDPHPKTDPPVTFIDATLRGGPHDGQLCRVPPDLDALKFHTGPEDHTYHRVGGGPVFVHESRVIDEMLGGTA